MPQNLKAEKKHGKAPSDGDDKPPPSSERNADRRTGRDRRKGFDRRSGLGRRRATERRRDSQGEED
jgi:hypothetical protein